ncbi:MAG: alpha/beta hydrolase family protein [Acidimicrobiales bacterium]
MPSPASWLAAYRRLAGRVRLGALGRLARVAPRTARFALRKGEAAPGLPIPRPPMTVGLLAGYALDEVVMSAFLGPSRFPDEHRAERVAAELAQARRLYSENGWLENPLGYHRQPPELTNRDVVISTGWRRGLSFRHLSWESGYEPRANEPGRDRWDSYTANRRAAADVVADPNRLDRPWLVCVHGYTMGYPAMDFRGLQSKRLRSEMGLNLALPVLPLHGPRSPSRLSGEAFLSLEMMNSVHGFAQAVWDIRRLISWIRQQGATKVGLYGVSLGGYTVALLAGIESGLDAVVSGVPVSDVPQLMLGHSPPPVRAMADRYGLAEPGAHTVVSPLALAPKIAKDRRFIFAACGDRISSPEQACKLWRHWEEPEICWYPSGHIGYLWSREVATFLGQSLRASLLEGVAVAAPGDDPPVRRTA